MEMGDVGRRLIGATCPPARAALSPAMSMGPV
jgi:hypothetical protein